VHRFLGSRLGKRTAQKHGHDCRNCPDHEWNAPAPCLELVRGEQALQNREDKKRKQLAADQRHVLKGGIKPAISLRGDLTHVGGCRAIFAANRETLGKPRDQERNRRWLHRSASAQSSAIRRTSSALK